MPRPDHLNLNGITAEKLCTPFHKIKGISVDASATEIKKKVREATDPNINIDSLVVFDQAGDFEDYVLVQDLISTSYQIDKGEIH